MNSYLVRRVLLGTLALLFVVTGSFAQDEDEAPAKFDVKAHYTKYEYRIPMRDGVRLFTAVYVPKDPSKPYPFLMTRTPYTVAPYGVENYPKHLGPGVENFAEAGYIFVYQDVRGRWMSEGKWEEMTPHIDHPNGPKDVDESTDTYDTVEWLLKHVPNNNGKVGIWGISYPGFYTSASIIDSHPAIKAASPQAPVTDLYMGDDAYHNGAFMLMANFEFYTGFKPEKVPVRPPKNGGFQEFEFGTSDTYNYFLKMGPLSNTFKIITDEFNPLWRDQLANTTYDEYWKKRNIAAHLHNIHCAVLTVGGWFDAEDVEGPLKTFHTINRNDPDTVNILVEGPWAHFTWSVVNGEKMGRVGWGSDTAKYFRTKIEFPFFERYLKGEGDEKFPKAYAFETGTNAWRQYASWPPAGVQPKTLYLREGGKLSFEAPTGQGFDEYVSDPNHPVPFVGYTTDTIPQEYMVSDQRFASRRTDVLTYATDPLEEDVTIAGPIEPKLFVSTTGTDSDFDVKLIDVYPEDYPEPEEKPEKFDDVKVPVEPMAGYQQLIRGEPFRGKFRHSFEKPEPFTPGKVEAIDFTMADVHHTFRRGHRIMVQVQSSWFPLTDRNPQTFTEIPNAKPEQFVKATERVYHENGAASGVVLQVLPRP